jgi:hypothetical protein
MALPLASEFLACDGSFRPSTSSAILSLAYGLSSPSSLLLVLCERGAARVRETLPHILSALHFVVPILANLAVSD